MAMADWAASRPADHLVSDSARPLLICGVTGRALAASARRGGYPTVVLDYFGDRDTVAAADATRVVTRAGSLHFDAALLLAAAAELAPPARSAGLVYGSGFEGRPALLARLARGRTIMGNSPAVIRALRDPARFFPLLDRLGIRYPAVRRTRPADPRGWLAKLPGGSGGMHVQVAGAAPARRGAYYQRRSPGRAMSALFLADGRRALIAGCNDQWLAPAPGLPFRYGGAMGHAALPREVQRDLAARLDTLVAATGLVGLNGLDFLLQGSRWLALEVNPRPPATLDLYDADYPLGLLHWHLRAVQGELPPRPAPARAVRAHLIVHAPAAGRLADDVGFPRWCRDLPQPGTRFAPEDPVCTVVASAPTRTRAAALVRRRHSAMLRRLGRAAALAVSA